MRGRLEMAKKKEPFTFENNISKVIPKIQEAPEKVLRVIGQNLVREVRGTLRQFYKKRSGELDKSLGYTMNRKVIKESSGEWPPAHTPELMIGFKKFYAPFVLEKNDPLLPVVKKNKDLIQKMIAEAIDQINKE